MHRHVLAAAVGAAFLIPAQTALAGGPGTGSYTGTTSQSRPVGFIVTAAQVRSFAIGVRWSCTDGDRFRQSIRLPTFAHRDGSVRATFRSSSGASTGRITLTIGSRSASGTFTVTRRYNGDDEPDPRGSVVCRTGTIRFTAARR